MKYVKLFESWLNSVNEGLSSDGLNKLTDMVGYSYDEDYAKNPDALAKHIVEAIESMFANAPEGYKIKLDYKIKLNEIILSTKIREDKNTFEFSFSKDNLLPSSVTEPLLLRIVGKAVVRGKFADRTTLAQFIYSNLMSTGIQNFNDRNEVYEDILEELLSISAGKKPVDTKVSKKKIAKMTAGDFYYLPSQKKIDLFNSILSGKFKVFKTLKNLVYVVAPTKETASKYGIEFDDSTEVAGGRYLTFQLASDKMPEDEDMSVANIPILWGASNLKSLTKQEIYNPHDAKSVEGVGTDSTKTTLAAFLFALLDLEKNGMVYGKGEKVTSQVPLISPLAKNVIKADDSDALKKKAEDAWKEKGATINMAVDGTESKGGAGA